MGAGLRRLLPVCVVASACLATAATANAKVCGARKVSATGETAQFALLAKVAARTAWSSKVAADARLGGRYSTWLRSVDRRLVCRKVERRHICLAIALPCRPGSAAQPTTASPQMPSDPKRRPL